MTVWRIHLSYTLTSESIHPHSLFCGSPEKHIKIDPVIPSLEIYLKELLSTRIHVQRASLKHYFRE